MFLLISSPSTVAVAPGVSHTADMPAATAPKRLWTLTLACVCLRTWTLLVLYFLWGSKKKKLVVCVCPALIKSFVFVICFSLFRALSWKWFLLGLFIYLFSFCDWLSRSFSIVSGWSMCVSYIKQSFINFFWYSIKGYILHWGQLVFPFDRFLGFHL